MKERDPVNVLHKEARHEQKVRLGVILAQQAGQTLVALGQSATPRDNNFVLLEKRSRDGRSLGLSNDTYFPADMMRWYADAEVDPRRHGWPCSLQLFKQLRAVFQEEVRRQPSRAQPGTDPVRSPTGPEVVVVRKRSRRP